jgi:hypothetical protein
MTRRLLVSCDANWLCRRFLTLQKPEDINVKDVNANRRACQSQSPRSQETRIFRLAMPGSFPNPKQERTVETSDGPTPETTLFPTNPPQRWVDPEERGH